MAHITLSEEQTQALTASLEPIEIRDAYGRVLAVVPPVWTREDIEEAKRRLADPNTKWYTTEQVLAHLRSLENK